MPTPAALLVHSSQRPLRGSEIANVPTSQVGSARPTPYTKSALPPSSTLRVVPIQVSSERTKGPVQGAATKPPTRPSTNAPLGPRPPICASRFCSAGGRFISNAPNIDAAIATKIAQSGNTNQPLARNEPNT